MMSSDWQEDLDVMILSLTRLQEDMDKIPVSRSRILADTQQLLQTMRSEAIQLMSMLKYVEDLGFRDPDD